jgi:C-terminal processing protease CtpA/Prc
VPLRSLAAATVLAALSLAFPVGAGAQSLAVDRQRGLQMLDQVREDLVSHYWDPGFGGVDLDAVIDRARQRINAAQSVGEILGQLAAVCLNLRDSHTRFLPPDRVHDVDYGWSWRYVGDRALVDAIDEHSDAHGKGLRRGDTVIEVAGHTLSRANHRMISYLLRRIRPVTELVVTIERGGIRRTLTLAARVRKRPKRVDLGSGLAREELMMRLVFDEASAPRPEQEWLSPGVLYWRVPDFYPEVRRIKGQIARLSEARRLVLDLRGNTGGLLDALAAVAGAFAPRGTVLVTQTGRAGHVPRMTRRRRAPVFSGPIVVLVDSRSESCAEMLAYFLQARGATVMGDTTDGLVRSSEVRYHRAGDDTTKVPYGVQVTVDDITMADGVRLEGRGVRPDVVSVPTADDLERGLDPVLAQAAATFGVTLDPQKAARFSRR